MTRYADVISRGPRPGDWGTAVRSIDPGRAVFVRFDAAELSIGGANQSVYAGKYGKYADINLAASASLAGPWYAFGNFSGSIFGLAYQVISGSAPLGVQIDGIAYEVPLLPFSNPFGRSVTAIPPRPGACIIARDLDESTPHYLEITAPQSVSEARRWRLMGFFLDRNAGYQDEQPHGFIPSDVYALTTTPAAITRSTVTSDASNYGAGIRKVHFYNTTAAAIQVSLSRTSSAANSFWSQSCPANGSVDYDPGLILEQNGYLFAYAGATGVNAYVLEAF
jgi:hypothetical protein